MAKSLSEAMADPFRGRSFKVFVVVEVVLFVGGFLIAQLGTTNTTLGAHPDVHRALGAVMGALGVAFLGAFVALYVLAVFLSVRTQAAVRTDF